MTGPGDEDRPPIEAYEGIGPTPAAKAAAEQGPTPAIVESN